MTVSYVHSPSFSSDATSPPQTPLLASSVSLRSSSPLIGSSSPRAPSRAFGTPVPAAAASATASVHRNSSLVSSSASSPALLDHITGATSIIVPNDRMEAGLSLRRSPIIHSSSSDQFTHEPPASETDHSRITQPTTPLDGPESIDNHYEPAFTADIDLNDRFVYRRPYVDRGLSHTNRRSQLILEQKFHQHRTAASPRKSPNALELAKPALPLSPRSQSARRPGTAPQHSAGLPQTPDSAPAYLNHASRSFSSTSPAGLRELTTGAAAQPASNRASWIRRTRDFEALSDSHHSHSSGSLEPAAPVTASTKASRRHSSFLAGDYRSATLIPILASNSFDIRSFNQAHRRSYVSDKPGSHASNPSTPPIPDASADSAGVASSKRDSMLSNGSSATSSKDGSHSVDNVEFDGDDSKLQGQSSASSGCGHDEFQAAKLTTERPHSGLHADAKTSEVFSTPRSSAEQDPAVETAADSGSENNTAQESSQSVNPSEASAAAEPKESAHAPSVASEPVPAPAIPSEMMGHVQTAVVPPTPAAPEWPARQEEASSPTSSPDQSLSTLPSTDDSPSKSTSIRSTTSLDKRPSSAASSFGTLAVPSGKQSGSGRRFSGAGRRDSAASIASASSTSTYRIRRKAVPSDVDASERRGSVASGLGSDAAKLSPQPSPTPSTAPLPPPKDDQVHAVQAAVQAARDPSGSDFMRMAQQAAQAHMVAKGANAQRGVSPGRQRPSTAAVASSEPAPFGLGISQQPNGSASNRNVSTDTSLGLGAPPSTVADGITPNATRTPSRATIKRPTTAPVGSGGQFRTASDAQKSMLEVEGQQFFIGNQEPSKPKPAQETSPSIPNAIRFIQHQHQHQHQRNVSSGGDSTKRAKRDSQLSSKPSSSRRTDSISTASTGVPASGITGTTASSLAGGWGLEQELKIVDKVRNANGEVAQRARPESMDKSRKAQDAKTNKPMLNFIKEDESDEVKAAAREAGIPEGSYAIHPPSMLQLFEASQCLVYNQNGEEVLFGDLFKKRRTLVCFLRHWWCGFCQQFAMSVRHIDPLPLKKANLDFIIVGQGDWQVIKSYREVMQVQYPMFADPKRNLYRALGMTLRTNDANPVCARPDYASMSMTKGILVAIKKGLFDMPIRNPGDMKLLGGDFILGPGLQCSFTHRMTTADGHMDIPRILAQAGCDLSLKTPKPMFTLSEKEARLAMLASGNLNRRQPRSLGRSKGKKAAKGDPATNDTSFGSASGSGMAGSISASSSNARFARPSLWGRFPGRFSKSQASLDNSSMVDLSNDFSPARGLSAGPRSMSAMRKASYDGRMRESFETQQTSIEFESRATSFDTRGGRPSDVSASGGWTPLNKAQSMSELRRRFETSGLGSLRSKGRQEASAAKMSLESHLTVPGGGKDRLQHSASNRSLRGAVTPTNGATTPTRENVDAGKKANSTGDKAAKPMSVFRNNVIAQANGAVAPAPATKGLGIATPDDDSVDGAMTPSAVESGRTSRTKAAPGPVAAAGLAAPGSFLMDLDVYDSLSAPAQQKNKPAGDDSRLGINLFDSGLSPSQFSDSGFVAEAADADSDTEPSMSATQSPARSQRTSASTHGSPGSALGPSASSSFYSFNTFRTKPLEHLVEEADEDDEDSRDRSENGSDEESEQEENDEPIEFEDGRLAGI